MNLATMRAQYRDGLGGRANDLPDAETDRDLNEAWQFELADLVLGDDTNDAMPLVLTSGKDKYDVDSADDMPQGWAGRLRQIERRDSILIDDGQYRILIYTRPETFNHLVTGTTNPTSGRPTYALWYSRVLRFWPVPDQSYATTVYGTYYRPQIPDTGIANEAIARAVVNLAVRRRAAYRGYDDILQRFALLAKDSQRELAQRGLMMPAEAPLAIDF